MAMRHVAFYGGSFNPIHTGHLETARYVLDESSGLGVDEFYFMPNASPPHKNTVKLPFLERVGMIEAALADAHDERLKISMIEQDSSVSHYTFDTLTALQEQFSGCKLSFIMGMDSLLDLHTWKRGYELITLANIIVLPRPHYDLEAINAEVATAIYPYLHDPQDQAILAAKYPELSQELSQELTHGQHRAAGVDNSFFLLKEPIVDISSTQLRAAISLWRQTGDDQARNLIERYLTPETWNYIQAHKLQY